MQSHPNFQQTSADAADAELEDLSSHASGESSKENGPLPHSSPGLDEYRILPPTLSSLSPVRPGFKGFPFVLGVHYDDVDVHASDLGDPTLSPGNPDCGHRWSLNSPPSGLLKQVSASFPAFERDEAGTIDGQILQGTVEIPACSTPLEECHAGEQNEGPCRSIHVHKSPCQINASLPVRFSPGPLHVLPSRGGQHAGGCDSAVARRGGWDFQIPDRTPLNIQLGDLHGTVLDQDIDEKIKGSGLMKHGSIHDTVWHKIEVQDVPVKRASRSLCSSLLPKLWQLLCWAILCGPQYWDGVILAWRTAEVPEESWILLGVFISLLGIYRCVCKFT